MKLNIIKYGNIKNEEAKTRKWVVEASKRRRRKYGNKFGYKGLC